MNKYQLWTEGYSVSGNKCKAIYHGEFEGDTFYHAVVNFSKTLGKYKNGSCIDLVKLTLWGCRFFDNEKDARKSFG